MLLLLAGCWLLAGAGGTVRAGEARDGTHTGVLIEPLPDAVDSHGGAGSVGGDPGASSVQRPPPSSPVGPAVLDSWNSRAGGGDGGAAVGKAQTGAGVAPSARSQASEDAVRALFDTAREALQSGRADEAQSLFERLVVEAPHSALAKQARRHLGVIYSGAAEPAVAKDTSAKASPAAHAPAAADAQQPVAKSDTTVDRATLQPGSAAARPSPLAPAVWRQRARPSQRFEEMLRAAVGDRIFFSVGSADLGGRARSVLERQAEWVGKFPDLYVVVEGHADEPGGEEINMAMGQQRAELVRERLIGAGISASRIDIESRGAKDRAVTCEGAICRSQNSRVVTRLMVVLPQTSGNRTPRAGEPSDAPKLASDAQHLQPGGEPAPRR